MTFTFVDLFAGIGGFHAALRAFGGQCTKAVEKDPLAASVYQSNWKHDCLGDITELATESDVKIPEHDVLVGGFPCQPFSKSGAQKGMDETRGTLFWNILRVIEERRPPLIILENVRNLAGPRHLHEWQVIIESLRQQGYVVSDAPAIMSPHLLSPDMGGRPQVRERVFICAVRHDQATMEERTRSEPLFTPRPTPGWSPMDWNLESDLPLDKMVDSKTTRLSSNEILWIDAWNELVEAMWELREGVQLPGFPLWADHWILPTDLEIPESTPKWKADFLMKNANFYRDHKRYLDNWMKRWKVKSDLFPPSRRKLEWQAQRTPSLWDTVMHFRPSGIRAKRPTYLPALVAITQTSIIGPQKRRISEREATRLQGLPDWFKFGDQKPSATYKQLGNGVNVGVVWFVVKTVVGEYEEILKKTAPHLVNAVLTSPKSPDSILADMEIR